jgi:hypothetical protein
MRWTSRFDAHYSRVSDVCVQALEDFAYKAFSIHVRILVFLGCSDW